MKSHNPSVFITGATSGIGEQLALDYASQGWHVYACGRNKEKLNNLVASGHNITPLCFDITDLDQTKQRLRSLDITTSLWIMNAGDCEYIDKGIIDAQLMARVMSVNVIGLANCIESIQGYFKPNDRLVIVGSIASEVALPRAEVYGASKAAVSYFARSLSLSLNPKGVDVLTVYPGFVQTPLTAKNDFPMPMLISVEQASKAIRNGVAKGCKTIYFPKLFTYFLRMISLLPYHWQTILVSKLIKD